MSTMLKRERTDVRGGGTHTYLAYNLRVLSDLPLPGFMEDDGRDVPTVEIRQERIPRDRLGQLNDDGNCLAGTATDLMLFRVERGEVIAYDPLPGADEPYMKAVLTGELMAALLRQRGYLVLHGSCVGRDGEAVGFIGNSGWGKSTLAIYFTRHGYRLLTDDVLAVDLAGDHPLVIPGHAGVKLQPDSGALLVQDYHTLQEAHVGTTKRVFLHHERFEERPMRLKALYVLENRTRAQDAVLPLSSQQAFIELVGHTRVTQLIKDKSFVQTHFAQCKRLLEQVPVRSLHRKGTLSSLPAIKAVVEEDLERL